MVNERPKSERPSHSHESEFAEESTIFSNLDPDKLNDPEAIVNRYDLRDRKRHTLNSKPTDLNTAQKDSKSTVSADYTTAKDIMSPATKTAKKGMKSESPRTARAHSEGANSRKTDEASESNEFSLSSMFPSIFGSSTPPAVLSGPARNTRSASQLSQSFRVPEIPKKPTNPRKDVIKFRSDYANKFAIGSKHTVNFFSGSYEDAQRKARNDVKLLVIFIHDPNDADSIKLIHESLNSSEFDKLVTNNKLIVWGVANDSEEGKYVAYTLHVFKFPFISLMCPRADNRMFSVRRISGYASAAELVERLESSIQITKDDLKELREQKKRVLKDRLIREEQEREYKKSAERDKQKILEAKKAREEKQEAEEEEQRKQKDTEERRKLIAAQREQLRQHHIPVPLKGETVNIQVRFPSGERFARKFALDDSLEELFLAILCHETCPDFFMVLSGYPRSQVPCAPEWYHLLLAEQLSADGLPPPKYTPVSSFRNAGMRKAVAVFVKSC